MCLKRNLFIICWLITGKGFSQTSSNPINIYADKINKFFVEAFKESESIGGNCNTPLVYKIRTRGTCPANLILSWSFSYYNCTENEKTETIVIHIAKGDNRFSERKGYQIRKIKTIINNTADLRIVNPPADFEIAGDNKIKEDGETKLSILSNDKRNGIRYQWSSNARDGFKEVGESVSVKPKRTTTYFARAELDGFFSRQISFVVMVEPKPEPPTDFLISAPKQIREGDTVSIAIKTVTPAPDVKWFWYSNMDEPSFASGKEVSVSPTVTTRYFLQADLNGKKLPFRTIVINVEKVDPPPNDFTISGVKTIMEGQMDSLYVISKNASKDIQWFWYRGNEKDYFASGEFTIVTPDETTRYKLIAQNYKKKSSAATFTVTVIVKSRPPSIEGKMKVCLNQSAKETYKVHGGRLGTGSTNWEWYEGSCGSEKLIGIGSDLQISVPTKTSTYFVRPNADKTVCKEFTIEIFPAAVLPIKIATVEQACPNELFTLRADGGQLMDGMKWVWYYQAQVSIQKHKLGEGSQLAARSEGTASYFVRAEGGNCEPSSEISTVVNIIKPPFYRGYIGKTLVRGKRYRLTANGVPAGNAYTIAWYRSGCGQGKIGTGNSIDYRASIKEHKIYMQPEGECDTLECSVISVQGSRKPSKKYVFLNLGIVSENATTFDNGVITFGSRFIYVRAKFDIGQLLYDLALTKENTVPEYEATNRNIINYPTNSGTHYVFNGESQNKRTAYTIGFLFGGRVIRLYAGAGYGKRDLLWQANIYYNNTGAIKERKWARNITESIDGFEGEAGLFLKFGGFNLMGGANIIYSTSQNRYYTDYHAGIGFSF